MKPWVLMRSSVTGALAERFGKPPAVTILSAGRGPLAGWEAELLNTSDHAFWREIQLVVDELVVVTARTAAAAGSQAEAFLQTLGDTPLGRVLFEDPAWRQTGALVPLAADGSRFGRACVWRNVETGDPLIVEELFHSTLACD